MSIISTNVNYTFNVLKVDLYNLLRTFNFLQVTTIGYSVLGNEIYAVKIGNGKNQVFYSASYHANEWITSIVLMKFIEDFCNAYVNNSNIYNYSARSIFNDTTIYLVPMVNPDGVNLVSGFYKSNSLPYIQANAISKNYPNIRFPDGWKANIRGVDLNLQFPANWEKAKEIKYSQGFTSPAPKDFVGYGPLTEPEVLAIYNFTLQHNFRLILAYHSQGEVIYWKYLDYLPAESYFIGQQFANSSGYSLDLTPPESAFAGYKDWFIQNYNRPGYTIEVGLGENPLPLSQFNRIYNDNIGILTLGAVL